MATFAHDSGDALTIRAVPAVRVALGVGLAMSWLVPISFELMESPHNRHEIRPDLWLATTFVAVPCLLSRLVVLRFDRRSRTLYYRRVSVLGMRTMVLPFAAIQDVQLSGTRLLYFDLGESLALRVNDRVLRFGGWDWVNVDRPRRRAWLASIRNVLWPDVETSGETTAAASDLRLRFSLRRILIAVVLVAVALGVFGWLEWRVQSRCVLAVLVAGCALFATTTTRWHALLLVLAIHYSPFFWMVRVSVPWGTTSGLIESIPFVPAAWVSYPLILARVPPDSYFVSWLCIVAPIQVLGVAWLTARSGCSALIASFVSFLLSVAGTVFLYGMYLA